MKKNAVHLGECYIAKVSGKLVAVRLDAETPNGGWDATNLGTRKKIRIKSAQRLRAVASGKASGGSGGTTSPVGPTDAPATRSAAESDNGPQRYDPDRCATPRCKGEPALTYMGKPLCQKCRDRQCAEERPSEMVTEGAVPLAEALVTSPVAAANEASWERAQPGSNDGANEERGQHGPHEIVNDDEQENADAESANTGDAGESEIEDMATKTKKSKKSKATKAATKAPTARKPKTAAAVKAAPTNAAKSANHAPARKTAPTTGDGKPKRVSAIDAAAVILKAKGEPMRSREIIEAAAGKGLWTSPAGKTPHATLDAAMRREINTKGKDARFTIEGRGLFGFNGKASA